MISENAIIFFDGDCIHCNKFINYVIHCDKGFFKLANQHSHQFLNILSLHGINPQGDDTIYLLYNKKILKKSKAIKIILSKCDNKGKLLSSILSIIPLFLADFMYDFFAKNRKLSSQHICFLPDKYFLARFI